MKHTHITDMTNPEVEHVVREHALWALASSQPLGVTEVYVVAFIPTADGGGDTVATVANIFEGKPTSLLLNGVRQDAEAQLDYYGYECD